MAKHTPEVEEEREQPPVTWKEMAAGTPVLDKLDDMARYLEDIAIAAKAIAMTIREDTDIDLTEMLKQHYHMEKVVELLSAALTITFSTRAEENDHPISAYLQWRKEAAQKKFQEKGIDPDMLEEIRNKLTSLGMPEVEIDRALQDAIDNGVVQAKGQNEGDLKYEGFGKSHH